MFELRIPLLEQHYCFFPLAFLPSLYQGIFQVSILTFPFFFLLAVNLGPQNLQALLAIPSAPVRGQAKACTASIRNQKMKDRFSENTDIPGSL